MSLRDSGTDGLAGLLAANHVAPADEPEPAPKRWRTAKKYPRRVRTTATMVLATCRPGFGRDGLRAMSAAGMGQRKGKKFVRLTAVDQNQESVGKP